MTPRMNHGRGLADGLLADAADVVGGAGQVAQHDGGGPPEADERQRDAADHQHVHPPLRAGGRQLDRTEIVEKRGSLHINFP